jgi:hypothetical protein
VNSRPNLPDFALHEAAAGAVRDVRVRLWHDLWTKVDRLDRENRWLWRRLRLEQAAHAAARKALRESGGGATT